VLSNRDELARLVLEGESTSLDDLDSALCLMIMNMVETAVGAEMLGLLGYGRYQTPGSDPGNRRNGYSHKELASKVGAIGIAVPGTGNPSSRRPSSKSASPGQFLSFGHCGRIFGQRARGGWRREQAGESGGFDLLGRNTPVRIQPPQVLSESAAGRGQQGSRLTSDRHFFLRPLLLNNRQSNFRWLIPGHQRMATPAARTRAK
jgi:hypothetical protein